MRNKKVPWNNKKGFPNLQRNDLFYFSILLSVVMLFPIGGCGEGTPPPSVPEKGKLSSIETKITEPAKVLEKKGMIKVEEREFTYNPTGKSDPFTPFIQLTPVKALPKTIPQTPLQNYEISQLKLVGVISTPEGNIALIEDSAGKGYFLKKDTWIGKNNGKVIKIFLNKVIIEETSQDIFGKTETSEITMLLHRPEGGEET